MAEQGLFDFLNRATMNPLFMGGLGLLSGGGGQGAMQGMQQGLMAQRQMTQDQELQQRKAAYQQAVQQGLFKDLPGGLGAMAPMMTPDQAIGLMGDFGKAKYGSDLNVSEKKQIMPLELAQRLAIINAQSAAELGAHKNKVQWDAANNPMVQADLGLKNAHARYYDSVGGARVQQQERLASGMGQTSGDFMLGFGMDDEGRIIRVQANDPHLPPPTRQLPTDPPPGPPQARTPTLSNYGATGVTSEMVPGIVTAQGRTDVPATRQLAGQQALGNKTADDRARLLKYREQQDLWTNLHGKPARAGHYYDDFGGEQPLSERGSEYRQKHLMKFHSRMLAEAEKTFEKSDYFTRGVLGTANIGEVGHAFSRFKMAALNMAYAMSGKQVAVSELKNFADNYAAQPGDSLDRIKRKKTDLLDGLAATIGKSPEEFRAFLAKNGSDGVDPAGGKGRQNGTGLSASEDPRSLSTEELLKRLR